MSSQGTVAQSPSNEKNDPFNLSWLSQHFKLDITKVKKDEFDIIGMYHVYFNDIDSATEFFNAMKTAGCYPQLWNFNNSVQLNKHLRNEMLQAAGRVNTLGVVAHKMFQNSLG